MRERERERVKTKERVDFFSCVSNCLFLISFLLLLLLLARHHEQRQHADQDVLDGGIVVHDDRHASHVREEADHTAHDVLAPPQPPLPAGVECAVVAPVVVSLGEQEGASRRLFFVLLLFLWSFLLLWLGGSGGERKRE